MNFKPKYVQLPNSVSSIEKLDSLGVCGVNKLDNIGNGKHSFPILTSEYFIGLMNKDDADDPLRKLVVPSKKELECYATRTRGEKRGSFDTSGEKHNLKAPGLQHKYGPTALALTSSVCAGFCRECFRKRLFLEGTYRDESTFPNPKAIEYLREHKEVNAILLSGGDVFMLTDESISQILDILDDESLSHITTLRFGTKTPAFFPQRFTPKLVQLLKDYQEKTRKNIQVAMHFEHPNELSAESLKTLDLINSTGITMYNQTVLLKGINDNADVLSGLFSKLAEHGVRPYYLFQCRPVVGSLQLQVSLVEGIKIYNETMQKLSGIHKPIYAMSTKIGKMQIVGLHPNNKNIVVLRKHSAKQSEKTGKVLFYNTSIKNPFWYEC